MRRHGIHDDSNFIGPGKWPTIEIEDAMDLAKVMEAYASLSDDEKRKLASGLHNTEVDTRGISATLSEILTRRY